MVSQILTRDDLRTLTPSVFATTPWEGMSPSYRFIPTADVLDLPPMPPQKLDQLLARH